MATVSNVRRPQATRSPLSLTSGRRLIVTGALLVGLTTVANVLVATALRAGLGVPATFEPLQAPAVITVTLVAMIAAALTFARLARVGRDPKGTFLAVAGIALILSWIPDGLILATGVFPGTTARGVLSLMSLHLLSAAFAIVILTSYGLKRN